MKYIKLYESFEDGNYCIGDILDYFYDLTDDGIEIEVDGFRKFHMMRFKRQDQDLSSEDISDIVDHLIRMDRMGEFSVIRFVVRFCNSIEYSEISFNINDGLDDLNDILFGDGNDGTNYYNFTIKANIRVK